MNGRKRDPKFTTGHLCLFCGKLVPWGTIRRLIRVDPDTPGFMLSESACHTDCLRGVLRPEVELIRPQRRDRGAVITVDHVTVHHFDAAVFPFCSALPKPHQCPTSMSARPPISSASGAACASSAA